MGKRISDKERLDWLIVNALTYCDYPNRGVTFYGFDGFSMDAKSHSLRGARQAIDAAIRASRRGGKR